jgi:hypothetical protein
MCFRFMEGWIWPVMCFCSYFLFQTAEMPIKAEILTPKQPWNKAKHDKNNEDSIHSHEILSWDVQQLQKSNIPSLPRCLKSVTSPVTSEIIWK